jgi:serine/threonine protein kinase/tetratricopeptide (TPR) repeat protein
MTQPPGLGGPISDSADGIMAVWHMDDADGASLPCPSDAHAPPKRSATIGETTVYPPAPARMLSSSGSLEFLQEFSLGGPDEDDSLDPPESRPGVGGESTRRRVSPGGSAQPRPLGIGGRGTGLRSSRLRSSRALPGPGDVLADFRILQELGRGAFARVYLAEELHLGGRLVAIKVSRAEGDEPRILARLQHANIVPVHSVCDDPATGLRVLCMPYFGGANLAQVLDTAGGMTTAGRNGTSLVQALDEISRRRPVSADEFLRPPSSRSRSGGSPGDFSAPEAVSMTGLSRSAGSSAACGSARSSRFRSFFGRIIRGGVVVPTDSTIRSTRDDPHQPSRQFLRTATAVQAAVWIAARLAEGLDHAHSRGLLHRDLKPANILLAADGTPMLLDFNLAAESLPTSAEGEVGRALVGGTLPYMAPEHLDAFDPHGSTPAAAVDERADIYALGLVLFEVLAGEHPFLPPTLAPGSSTSQVIEPMIEARRHPPSLKVRNPQVPWSLHALVGKCLEFDPGRRYARARDLAEDLRRFLDDRPMKHAPEPSLRERIGKFARRHKTLCSSTSIALFAFVFIMSLGAGVAVVHSAMQGLMARFQRQAFERDFTEAQFLLNTASASDRHLTAGLIEAQRLFDRLHFAEGQRDPSAGWFHVLTSAERSRLREQIVELTLLEARARILMASRQGTESDRLAALRRACARLDRAERIADRLPSALFSERARYHAALGDAALAERDRRRSADARPATSRDWTLLGMTLLSAGDTVAAEDALRNALRIECTSFWAWFMLGHCHFAQARFVEAAGDFSACTALGPQFAWSHFNRGLALARSGRLSPARDAYDQALRLDPDFVEAFVNRALVELELNEVEAALSDLDLAIRLGRRDVGILAARGEALARLGRGAEARQQFDTLLSTDPDNAVVRVARGMTQLQTDPHAARKDFTHVLGRDPRHAAAHYGMALIVRADNLDDARRHLDAALDADANLVDALQLRTLVLARLGDRSALDDVDRLLKIPTAQRCYNAACAVAVYADKAREPQQFAHALELFRSAVDLGFPAADAADDPDLAPLRGLPAFQRILARRGQ